MSEPRLVPLDPASMEPAQRALFECIVEARAAVAEDIGLLDAQGRLGGPFDPILRSPSAGDALQQIGLAFKADSVLTGSVIETVVLTVVNDWNATFEWVAHRKLALKSGALSEEDADAIASGAGPTEPLRRLAWRLAAELVTKRELSADLYAEGTQALSERGVVEVVLIVGYYSTLALLLRTFVENA